MRCRQARQVTDEIDVQGMAASAGNDVRLQHRAEQCQVPHQIDEFVTRWLIGKSRSGEETLGPNP
jgi:hypothetical protein